MLSLSLRSSAPIPLRHPGIVESIFEPQLDSKRTLIAYCRSLPFATLNAIMSKLNQPKNAKGVKPNKTPDS